MTLFTISTYSSLPCIRRVSLLRPYLGHTPFIMNMLTAAVLVATPVFAQDSPSDSLSLSLTSDKAHYSSRDPITLTITLENRSLHDITVNKRMAHPGPDLMLDIEDVLGNKLRWLPAAPPPVVTRDDFTVLSAGEKLMVPISDIEIGLFDKFQRDHRYRVKARYQNTEEGRKFNYTAWTGSLTSNTIMFEWKG
jgi:hypothetical protein